MKISYNWLKDHIELTEQADDIANILTKSGLEVEKTEVYESIKGGLEGLIVAEVLTCEKHPDADKLKKTTVNTGNGIVPVVCGAPNVAAGQKVILATVGATLYPKDHDPITIKKAKIRGEVSEGMICAEDEIGLGTSHEGIMVLDTDLPAGTPASVYFNIESDTVFEIGLTPNRADAASHLGVARDLKALLKKNLKTKEISFSPDNTSQKVEVIVENKEACPRYAGVTISNLKVQESPDWLKNKLKSIGLSPINNVVDITNYILHDLGQPLHAFDLAKVKGNKVIVKTVAAGTKFVTLDGVERKLSANDLMICNESEPMCIAGVFGGLESGVTDQTTAIFLESAYFSPDYIRKTGQHHGLKTDASFRFERGTDPNMPVYALKKAATLLKEVAGGEISSDIIDIYPEPIKNFEVQTSYSRINRLIGKSIPKEVVKEILGNLDIKVISEQEDDIHLSIPPYRVDVQREADIVEEVLRIYGYDNIELGDRLSSAYLADFPLKEEDKIKRTISKVLSDNGFNETVTNSLTKPGYADLLNVRDTSVEILNKLSEDLGVMRQSLLFSGLEVITYNINRKQKDLKLFEFGKTYHKTDKGYEEKNHLALFMTGNVSAESWMASAKPVDFYALKTEVVRVLTKLNLKDYELKPLESPEFSLAVSLVKNGKELVRLGEVASKISKAADVKQTVFYADFNMDLLIKQFNNNIEYKEISKYPEVRRDLSLVLDKKVSFDEIRNLAIKTERKLITDINVFDVYEGKNIGEDKKSYSISFILQDYEKTLTDKVIDNTMQKLMDAFEKQLGAVIRK
ncbi:MAG TPA: phenylalanine--tRNA ligase subunit beta [Cytophagaceae bacterium]